MRGRGPHMSHGPYKKKGIYILVDTYMRFLERGRELIAAQVVEKIVRSAS